MNRPVEIDVGKLERALLEWFESREGNWKWFMGGKRYSKEETIRLFKEDKDFRQLVIEEAVKTQADTFLRAAQEPPEAGEKRK